MKIDLEKIFEECILYAMQIKNPSLRKCAQEILLDYKERLISKPATPGSHHYFKGGLLYHIYCVTRNSIQIMDLYQNLKIDKDLVIFGALLHDIGKSQDFNDFVDDKNYKPHDGNSFDLLGHSYEGTHIVENYLSKYNLEENFKNQAIHMIGSHMNEYSEWGALVMPKMLEVLIISYSDSMDAYFEPAHSYIEQAQKGEKYKIPNAPRAYYKSLNPYYDN